MSELEARRVQKLGASSLIITLPKEWARDLGIKPGSIVYLRREGNTIRILPSTEKKEETIDIEFRGEHGKRLALRALTCLYILGVSDARVRSSGFDLGDIEIEAKRRALDLIGVEAFSEDDSLRIRVLVEVDESNMETFAKTIATNTVKAFRLLERIVAGRYSDSKLIFEEIELLQKETIKYQHAILRAFSRGLESSSDTLLTHVLTMISRHLVLATNIVLEGIKLLLETEFNSFNHEVRGIVEILLNVVTTISKAIVARDLPNYDVLEENIGEAIRRSRELLKRNASRLHVQDTIVLTTSVLLAKILNVITVILVCKEIVEKIRKAIRQK